MLDTRSSTLSSCLSRHLALSEHRAFLELFPEVLLGVYPEVFQRVLLEVFQRVLLEVSLEVLRGLFRAHQWCPPAFLVWRRASSPSASWRRVT